MAPSSILMSNLTPLIRGGFEGSGCPNRSMFAYNCALKRGMSIIRLSPSVDIITSVIPFITTTRRSSEYLSQRARTNSFWLSITSFHSSSGNFGGFSSGRSSLQCVSRYSWMDIFSAATLAASSSTMTVAAAIISSDTSPCDALFIALLARKLPR